MRIIYAYQSQVNFASERNQFNKFTSSNLQLRIPDLIKILKFNQQTANLQSSGILSHLRMILSAINT